MTVKILTPEGGTPTYHLVIALRNEIIGSITFKNKTDAEHFQQMYNTLQPLGFGFLDLHIDVTDDEG
jgi:hypothetical protein